MTQIIAVKKELKTNIWDSAKNAASIQVGKTIVNDLNSHKGNLIDDLYGVFQQHHIHLSHMEVSQFVDHVHAHLDSHFTGNVDPNFSDEGGSAAQNLLKFPALSSVYHGEQSLKPGDNSKSQVGALQDLLRAHGYCIYDAGGTFRGVYGGQTEKAVKDFQEKNGLPPTGVTDHATLEKLLANVPNDGLVDGLTKRDSGVKIAGLVPEMKATFPKIVDVWAKAGAPAPVITSGNDSVHTSPKSRHYQNRAIDLRGNNVSDSKMREIAKNLQNELGPNYLVIAEFPKNEPGSDHIHVEYRGK